MSDRKRELVPDNRSLVRERALVQKKRKLSLGEKSLAIPGLK